MGMDVNRPATLPCCYDQLSVCFGTSLLMSKRRRIFLRMIGVFDKALRSSSTFKTFKYEKMVFLLSASHLHGCIKICQICQSAALFAALFHICAFVGIPLLWIYAMFISLRAELKPVHVCQCLDPKENSKF
uniref:Uncharacterized protein n=1 Tax=Parascaris univalens TaxID=6257 RepID=A0A915CKR3_PARUN